MSEIAKVVFTVLAVVFVLFAIFACGVCTGRQQVRREACRAKCGQWVLNEYGVVRFEWKAGD